MEAALTLFNDCKNNTYIEALVVEHWALNTLWHLTTEQGRTNLTENIPN